MGIAPGWTCVPGWICGGRWLLYEEDEEVRRRVLLAACGMLMPRGKVGDVEYMACCSGMGGK
jgi:hypothetical protein